MMGSEAPSGALWHRGTQRTLTAEERTVHRDQLGYALRTTGRRRRLAALAVVVLAASVAHSTADAPPAHAMPTGGVISTYAVVGDPQPRAIAIRPNGEVLVTRYGGQRSRIDRVLPDGSTETIVTGDICPVQLPPAYGYFFCQVGAMAAGPDGSAYAGSGYDYKLYHVRPDNTVDALAGIGVNGFSGDGGPANQARISGANAIGVDDAGNVYFADGYRIRRVDTDGIITTIAGTGVPGFSGDGGPATAAMIHGVSDIDTDHEGNIYFTDHEQYRVRRIDADGIITTFAGNGVRTYAGDGGLATDASFAFPYSVAIDDAGVVYVADSGSRIRAIDGSGIIDTVAGTGTQGYTGDGGPAIQADMSGGQLDVHPNGDLYMTHSGNAIRRVTWHGAVAGNATAGGAPAEGVTVTLMKQWPSWEVAATTTTDAAGQFRFDALEPGSYRVRFFDGLGRYQRTWLGATTTYKTATPITVTVGNETLADQALPPVAGMLTGRVTDQDTHAGLNGIRVLVFDATGYVAGATTGPAGHYTLHGLPPGTYWVRFIDPTPAGHQPAWYPGVPTYATATTGVLGNDTLDMSVALTT
jgi:5-hydroxyisourate hydrolase-like protein (transthyretin family)